MGLQITVVNGSGSGYYSDWQYVGITANSLPGRTFADWSESKYSTTGYITSLVINPSTVYTGTSTAGELTATANYNWIDYTLTYTAGAGGSIVGASPQTLHYGQTGTSVTATPATGYRFVKWSDDNTNATRSDTMGTSNISLTATFEAAAPVVTSLNITEGNKNGGDTVVITGSYFTSATAVKFGTTNAASYVVNSSTQITSITPAHAEGVVDVSVTTGYGTGTKSNAFEFITPTGSVGGTMTSAGAITKKELGKSAAGVIAPEGTFSYFVSHANERGVTGQMGMSGVFTYAKLRPITLKAPFVPTTYKAP